MTMLDVLRSCHVFEIVQTVIVTHAIFVINFMVGWTRADKRAHDELMNPGRLAAPGNPETHKFVPGNSPWPEIGKWFAVGSCCSSLHVPDVAYPVVCFKSGYWEPFFFHDDGERVAYGI